MKKNIGSHLALYPMPVTVIGAMNGDKPTWTLVAHVGIIGHDRLLVSLADIRENKMPRTGIEPVTRGFSVRCSTN